MFWWFFAVGLVFVCFLFVFYKFFSDTCIAFSIQHNNIMHVYRAKCLLKLILIVLHLAHSLVLTMNQTTTKRSASPPQVGLGSHTHKWKSALKHSHDGLSVCHA